VKEKGSLVLVATPIGNLSDLSPRAIEALISADLWFVEDTRISGKLQSHLGLHKPMRVLNDHTREEQIQKYLEEVRAGSRGAVLTDGGAPVVSDPGAILCDLCHEAGIVVDGIPGPSAPILALTLSGFFGQRFAFLGFLPRKAGDIKSELKPFAESPLTLILFESQFRIGSLLEAAHAVLGERRYAICREMTKSHEQVFRSRLPLVPSDSQVPRKGEFTVVIEGKRRGEEREA
jgi:16S rRNA (cytidine1402-2'-O)-methyltransferase